MSFSSYSSAYNKSINDQIVYYEVEKSLFEKIIRKEKRHGLLESRSIKKTQRRSMNRRKKQRFHLLACGSKSGAGFRVGLLAPKDTTWGRGILKNALIKKSLCLQLLAQ